jgi:hypothetical protein
MTDIYSLLYHLKKCPEMFLNEHSQAKILIKDIYRKIYGNFNISDNEIPTVTDIDNLSENHILSVQIGCWFFSFQAFKGNKSYLAGIHNFFFEELHELSTVVNHRSWIEDDDRAEEFIRLALRSCDIIPNGETSLQAADRLDALDTLKRMEVLRQSNDAYERIREIRRKMAEEKAREAANVYGRE